MYYIDTHAHLTNDQYDNEVLDVLKHAKKAGVIQVLMPDVDSSGRDALFALCDANKDFLRPMVGLHPTIINDLNGEWREEVAKIEDILKSSPAGRFCAIGEIGLDYYWSQDFIPQQKEAFLALCELALEYNLPVNIHTRDAWSDMCDLLEQFKGRGLRGVMHAFCDTEESYRRISECGDFYFAIGGVVTFKKSQVAAVVPSIPLERMLLETDAPYLTPAPHRGTRNEPAMLSFICEKIAEIKTEKIETVARVTTENAKRIFNLR
ncbi:MAG: TatD family hydrolase [Rikenellaceae bacterium]